MSKATLEMSEWTNFVTTLTSKVNKVSGYLKSAFSVFGFSDVISHFKNESGPDSKWQSRTPETQKTYEAILMGKRKPPKGMSRAAFNPKNKILHLTGNLRKGILITNIRKKSKTSIEFFSNSIYSRAHDLGSTKQNLPQREFMWLSESAKEKMSNYLLSELGK